jgi:hypothetical protein
MQRGLPGQARAAPLHPSSLSALAPVDHFVHPLTSTFVYPSPRLLPNSYTPLLPPATLIYHGDESFITDPSESLQRILKDYDIPKFSNFTRRLFPQSGKDTEDLHRRLVAEVLDDMYDADGQKVTHRQLVGMIEAGEEIALYDAHGRKLFLPAWIYYVARVVWRYVAKRVYKWVLNYAGRWVQQQVTEYVTCAYYNGVEYC